MRYLLVFLFFLLIPTVSFTQSFYEDVVHLKNGSIIKGIIIEEIPNTSIKIETADKDVFLIYFDEIEKFTKDFTGSMIGLQSGYRCIMEFGFQYTTDDVIANRIKLGAVFGRQYNPYFYYGIGIGMRHYRNFHGTFVPIYTNFRGYFNKGEISPYVSIDFGYSFEPKYNFREIGPIINPSFGLNLKYSKSSSMHVAIGYDWQNNLTGFFYNTNLSSIPYHLKMKSGAVSIDFGVSF